MTFKEGEYTDLPCPICKQVGYEKDSRIYIIPSDKELMKTKEYQLGRCLNCLSLLKIEEREDV